MATLTRQQVKDLSAVLTAALESVSVPGYKLRLGNCSYGTTATFKLECLPIIEGDRVATREADEWNRFHGLFHLPPDALGQTIVTSQGTYTIDGLNMKAAKFPVMATRSDGKKFKLSAATVRNALFG